MDIETFHHLEMIFHIFLLKKMVIRPNRRVAHLGGSFKGMTGFTFQKLGLVVCISKSSSEFDEVLKISKDLIDWKNGHLTWIEGFHTNEFEPGCKLPVQHFKSTCLFQHFLRFHMAFSQEFWETKTRRFGGRCSFSQVAVGHGLRAEFTETKTNPQRKRDPKRWRLMVPKKIKKVSFRADNTYYMLFSYGIIWHTIIIYCVFSSTCSQWV